MSRSASKRLDSQRIVAAAVEAFLDGESRVPRPEADEHRRHRGGAVVLGVVIGLGAHVVYRRARELDLAQVAHAVERRIVN